MTGWLGAHRACVPQGEGDPGRRMDRAADAAHGADLGQVGIIGSDCPELNPGLLKRAFDLLISFDVVLGPALDGGYSLVGIRSAAWERSRRPLFTNIPWGTTDVLTESVRRTHAAGLEVARLEFLGDVHRPKALILWKRVSRNTDGSQPFCCFGDSPESRARIEVRYAPVCKRHEGELSEG